MCNYGGKIFTICKQFRILAIIFCVERNFRVWKENGISLLLLCWPTNHLVWTDQLFLAKLIWCVAKQENLEWQHIRGREPVTIKASKFCNAQPSLHSSISIVNLKQRFKCETFAVKWIFSWFYKQYCWQIDLKLQARIFKVAVFLFPIFLTSSITSNHKFKPMGARRILKWEGGTVGYSQKSCAKIDFKV